MGQGQSARYVVADHQFDGQVRSRLVGESRQRLDRHLVGRSQRLGVCLVPRQPAGGPAGSKSQEFPRWDHQNGRTMTITTMITTSSVGTSLAMR
jgi:hypothetical protein